MSAPAVQTPAVQIPAVQIPAVRINGSWQLRLRPVVEAFANNFVRGDLGASFAVVQNGELVVDIWGGHLDVERTQPWQQDTIVNVYSSTKTMTFLAALLLADRGQLDLHAPVAKYWPEFAANGKQNVKVSHLLAHSAGLSGIEQPVAPHDLYDWDKITGLLAAQAPWWEPGSASGYHAITQGYLIGEVVRRITGKTFGAFLREEITGPLGTDFHVGVAPQHDARIACLMPVGSGTLETGAAPDSIAARTLRNPAIIALQSREIAWRRAEIPASNGHGNARSLALTQAALVGGGKVNGRPLLSVAGARRALEKQISGTDLVLGGPATFGMGYGLRSAELPMSPNENACFWGGWGGSIVVIDFDAQLVFAYVMNQMGEGTVGDLRGGSVGAALYGAIA